MRNNANHVSNRYFWYIVDRREATQVQIQRRWSPETAPGDVLIVDVDLDNWDCSAVKEPIFQNIDRGFPRNMNIQLIWNWI
jgi:hypothetical protein